MFKGISLRKINAFLVIIIFLMISVHAILAGLYLAGITDYSLNFKITGRRLFYPVIVHVIISLYLFLKDKLKQRKIRIYPKLIRQSTQQVVSGFFILLFVVCHIFNYSKGFNLNNYFVDLLLFISIATHLRVSFPRFLISLGFLTDKNSYKKAKKYTNIFLLIIVLLLALAESIYYWM